MIHVLQGDYGWLSQLKIKDTKPDRYKIHSVFDHAINLQDEQGKLYTLVGRDVSLAPNTLRLSCVLMNNFNIHIKETVTCTHGFYLQLEKYQVSFAHALPWMPKLPAYQIFNHNYVISSINCLLQKQTINDLKITKVIYAQLENHYADFRKGWRHADKVLMKKSLVRTIGLGLGLTPSGDDIFVGLCAILALPGNPVSELFPLCREVVVEVKGATHEISYAALLHAVCGRFNAPLHDCLDIFVNDDFSVLEEKLKAVLAIGSTSGADMLLGLRMGLSLIHDFYLNK